MAATIWRGNLLANAGYRWLITFGRALGALGVSPNALTYSALLFAVGAAAAASLGYFVLAGGAVALAGACDALDGIVARSTGKSSAYGALLDSAIDRVVDALPLVGVLIFHAFDPLLAAIPALALLASIVIPYTRARAEALGARLPTLFMRRPERVVLQIVSLFLGGAHVARGAAATWLLVATSLLASASVAGCVALLRAARAALTEPDRPNAPKREASR